MSIKGISKLQTQRNRAKDELKVSSEVDYKRLIPMLHISCQFFVKWCHQMLQKQPVYQLVLATTQTYQLYHCASDCNNL